MRHPWLFLCIPLLALGCASKTSVKGKVSYDGRPVEYGHILFTPADDRGPAVGADILNGEYEVHNISQGSKRVLIKSKPTPKRVAKSDAVREHEKAMPPANPVDAKAVGNNEVIEIKAGDQELDFSLSRP
jgi:hypothetical protein